MNHDGDLRSLVVGSVASLWLRASTTCTATARVSRKHDVSCLLHIVITQQTLNPLCTDLYMPLPGSQSFCSRGRNPMSL